MWQRFFATAIVVILVIVGGYYAYHALMPDDAQAGGPVYATAEVIRDDLSVTIEGFGKLNPIYSSSIQTETGGFLESLTIKQGDTVHEGQIVGRIRNEELVNEIRTLELDMERTVDSLASVLGVPEDQVLFADPNRGISLVAPIDGRVVDLNIEENEQIERNALVARIVDDSKVRIVAEFTPSQFSHVSNDMEVELRFKDFSDSLTGTVVDANPIQIPRGTHFVHTVTIETENPGLLRPGQQLDVVIPGSVTVAAVVDSYNDETVVWSSAEGTIASVAVREWQQVETGEVLAELGGMDTRRFIYDEQMKIRDLQEQLGQKRQLLDRTEIRSPIDGVVAYAMQNYGYELQPGQHIASIIDNTRMALDIQVDEIDIVHIEEGLEATVTVEAFPGEVFPAAVVRVDFMGHDEEGITVYGVYLEVEQTKNIQPGMSANVSIYVAETTGALLVPIEAVYDVEGTAMVDVLVDDKPEPTAVELGLTGSRYAEVIDGINEGDVVVTGSSGDLLGSESPERYDGPSLVPDVPEPARPGR
ncbi:MAG: efflux RND transporter periplasmic adaptor subunit [Bacillota bacterium]